MAITLPAGFQSELEERGSGCSFVYVYELALAAATLYYSDQELTWGGNDYTAKVLSASDILHEMGARVPEVRVTFSNVNNTLSTQLDPDLITGRRMTVRLLIRDATGSLLAGSVTRHLGLMERPRRSDENTIEITSIGLARGRLGLVPTRSTSKWCNVHKFADGVDCNYGGNTTTDDTYAATTTIPVAHTSAFTDELARLPTGSTPALKVGTNTTTLVSVITPGASGTIQVGDAITGGSGETVRLLSCDRTSPACDVRARRHEFQGFLGRNILSQLSSIIDLKYEITDYYYHISLNHDPDPIYGNREEARRQLEALLSSGKGLLDRRQAVPILYGLRNVSGVPIESSLTGFTGQDDDSLEVRIFLLSEGEIEAVIAWYADGTRLTVDDDIKGGDYKRFGIYYRNGEIGQNDDESGSEYHQGTGDWQTWYRRNNRDILSLVNDAAVGGDTLSRSAYVTQIQRRDNPEDQQSMEASFEVKGIKVWRYTAAASATHLPGDGARVWSRNPIWQAVDLMTAPRYGMGRVIAESDIDFTVTQPTADYCDTLITGPVATVGATPLGNATDEYVVDDTSFLEAGMAVVYDDNGTGTYVDVDDTVLYVIGDTRVKLATARADAAAGDTITAKVPRYESDAYITKRSSAESAISTILASCNGYITYNEDGKIQIRVERTGSSEAHYKDASASVGYGIIDGSFELLADEERFDPEVNRVHLEYIRQSGVIEEAVSTDLDHLETPNILNPVDVRVASVSSREVAMRLSDILRKKHRLGPSARFTVGPIGIQHQPGSIVTVTYAPESWSGKLCRVRRVESIGTGPEELLTRITVEQYDSTIYDVTTSAITDPPGTSVEISAVTASVNWIASGRVLIVWTITGSAPATFSVYKSTSSMGSGLPSPNNKVHQQSGSSIMRYEYIVADSEFDSPLYFIVVANAWPGGPVVSNEVSPTPQSLDPTDTQFSPGVNTVYDGGFETAEETWNAGASVAVTARPDQNYAPVGLPNSAGAGAYSTPANAYDADAVPPVTAATAATPATKIHGFRFTTGGAGEDGVLSVMGTLDGYVPPPGGNSHQAYYSTDNGTTWLLLGHMTNFAQSGYLSVPLTNVDRTQIEIAVRCGGVAACTGSIWDTKWETFTGAGSWMSGGWGVVQGDGGASYGTLSRIWPGTVPSAAPIGNGTQFTTQIRAFTQGSAPTDPLLVQLHDTVTDTYYDLIGGAGGVPVSASYLGTAGTLRGFCGRWTAPAAIQGDWEIVVRTLSTVAIYVDNLMTMEGDRIHLWTPSEAATVVTTQRGQIDGFTPHGQWVDDNQVRVSEVTGWQI